MAEKKPFRFHVAETRHFEFEVWARNESEAREMGIDIWRDAATTGQWELPDQETEYEARRPLAERALTAGQGR